MGREPGLTPPDATAGTGIQESARPKNPMEVFLAGEEETHARHAAAIHLTSIYTRRTLLSQGFDDRFSQGAHQTLGLQLKSARANVQVSRHPNTVGSGAFIRAEAAFNAQVVRAYEDEERGKNPEDDLLSLAQKVAERMAQDLHAIDLREKTTI